MKRIILSLLLGIMIVSSFSLASGFYPFPSYNCDQYSTHKECIEEKWFDWKDYKHLIVHESKYFDKDSNQWKNINNTLKLIGVLKNKKSYQNVNYGIEELVYNVYITNNDIKLTKDLDEFTINTGYPIIKIEDNKIIYDISDPKIDATLTYTFNHEGISKVITINKLKGNHYLKNNFTFNESYNYLNDKNGFKIDDIVNGWDSNVSRSKYYYTFLTINQNKVSFTIPSWFLQDAVYPVYIDPSLTVDGTTTILGGFQNFDFVEVKNGGILQVNNTNHFLTLNVSQNITVDSTSQIRSSFIITPPVSSACTGATDGSNNGNNLTLIAPLIIINGKLNNTFTCTIQALSNTIFPGITTINATNFTLNHTGQIISHTRGLIVGVSGTRHSIGVTGNALTTNIHNGIFNGRIDMISQAESVDGICDIQGAGIVLNNNITFINNITEMTESHNCNSASGNDISITGGNFTINTTGTLQSSATANGGSTYLWTINLTGTLRNDGMIRNQRDDTTLNTGFLESDKGNIEIYAENIHSTRLHNYTISQEASNLGTLKLIATNIINISGIRYENGGTSGGSASTAILEGGGNVIVGQSDIFGDGSSCAAGSSHGPSVGNIISVNSTRGNINITGVIDATGGGGTCSGSKDGTTGGRAILTSKRGNISAPFNVETDGGAGAGIVGSAGGGGGFITFEGRNIYLGSSTYKANGGTGIGSNGAGGNITQRYCENIFNSTATYDVSGSPTGSINTNTTNTWCSLAPPVVTQNSPANGAIFASSPVSIAFNCTSTASEVDILTNTTLFINGQPNVTQTGSSNVMNFLQSVSLTNGDYNWACRAFNDRGQSTITANRTFTINSSIVGVFVSSPSGIINYGKSGIVLTLNWAVVDAAITGCYYNYNNINTTVTCSQNTTTFNSTAQKSLVFFGNYTNGTTLNYTANWDYQVFEGPHVFNNRTTTLSAETFTINLTINSMWTGFGADLIYNNTRKGATLLSQTGNNLTFTKTITAPAVSVTTIFPFFWEVSLANATANITVNTDPNQTVDPLSIDNCTANNITILNYTLRDEDDQTFITPNVTSLNTTININLIISSIINNSDQITLSTQRNNTNPVRICINSLSNTSIYRMDTQAQYFTTSRVVEFHNIQNASLRNSTIPFNVDLFDLRTINAQSFFITFKDGTFLPVPGVLIDVTRKYVQEGVFKSVEAPVTDSLGQTIAHLVLEDQIYTFIVKKDGVILATFSNIVAICQDISTGQCTLNLNAAIGSQNPIDFTRADNLLYTLNFNDTARLLSLTFTTIDGSSAEVSLNATKFDALGNSTACSTQISSSSGVITCTIPASFGNASFEAKVFSNGNFVTYKVVSLQQRASEIFGGTGTILLVILYSTLVMMFISSSVGIIIASILGFIMAAILNIYTGGNILGIGSTILWFIIAGGIIIWKIARLER